VPATRENAFRYLWSATAVSNLGDGVTMVAFPWLATLVTDDPMEISMVAVAGRLPWLVMSIPAGALLDLVDRRAVLLWGNGVRLAAFAGLTVAVALDALTLPMILVTVFGLGVIEVGYDNAAQTMVPAIVAPPRLADANGKIRSVELATNEFAGKPLGGLLVGLAPAAPFAVRAVASLVVLGLVTRLPRDRPQPAAGSCRLGFALAGARSIWTEPSLRAFTLLTMLVNVALSFVVATQVLFAQRVLGLSAFGFGLLLSASAVGGVLGGQLCGRLARRWATGGVIVAATALLGWSTLMVATTTSPVVVGALYVASSAEIVVIAVMATTARQQLTDPALLGRVNAAARLLGWLLTPAAFAGGGVFVARLASDIGTADALRSSYALAGSLILLVVSLLGREILRHDGRRMRT
jgi:Na+/melibiose symporter-like transporter